LDTSKAALLDIFPRMIAVHGIIRITRVIAAVVAHLAMTRAMKVD